MNKNIFICYKNLPTIEKYSLNWKKLNPDWKIHLFDDQKCIDFLEKTYGTIFKDIFNFIKDGPIKSDFWRVCILYYYGGLYVDADIEPIKPLSFFINESDDFITCISSNSFKRGNLTLPSKNKWHSNPHFIYSKNKNLFIFKYCINQYIKYYNNAKPYSYWGWSIVGIFDKLMFFPGEKKSGIFFYKKLKFKLLLEINMQYCTYNKVRLFNNRYKEYKNHKFKSLK
ncbi:glycosyltransferase [bacterium]|nr:glycosyltransferase [bacterium]